MRAEQLKRWLATVRKSEKEKAEKEVTTTERAGMKENSETSAAQSDMEADNWMMVVDLVQSAFREGKLTEKPRGRRCS